MKQMESFPGVRGHTFLCFISEAGCIDLQHRSDITCEEGYWMQAADFYSAEDATWDHLHTRSPAHRHTQPPSVATVWFSHALLRVKNGSPLIAQLAPVRLACSSGLCGRDGTRPRTIPRLLKTCPSLSLPLHSLMHNEHWIVPTC